MANRICMPLLAAAMIAGLSSAALAVDPYYSPYQPGYGGNPGFGTAPYRAGTLHAYGVPERNEIVPTRPGYGTVVSPTYGSSTPPYGGIYRPGFGE
jgi:hypothetical protein